jgi:hypothetical protein
MSRYTEAVEELESRNIVREFEDFEIEQEKDFKARMFIK